MSIPLLKSRKQLSQKMDRHKQWEEIRETLPGSFFNAVKSSSLEREIRLSKPNLKGQFKFTPFTDLERHHQLLESLNQSLEHERTLSHVKQEEFSIRWNLAHERNIQLVNVINKFASFHQNSQSLIRKNNTRAKQLNSETKAFDEQLQHLTKQLEYLSQVKETLMKRRDLCERYKDYMQSVVLAYNQSPTLVKGADDEPYSKIQDLLGRYDDLKSIREMLASNVVDKVDQSVKTLALEDKEKDHFVHEDQSYQTYSRVLNDYSKQLSGYVGGLNEKLISVKKDVSSQIVGAERPKMNIYALYCNLAKEMRVQGKLKRSDVVGQLNFIQKYLGEMKKIKLGVKKHLQPSSDVAAMLPDMMVDIERTSYRSSV